MAADETGGGFSSQSEDVLELFPTGVRGGLGGGGGDGGEEESVESCAEELFAECPGH